MGEQKDPYAQLAAASATAILILYKCLRKSGVPEHGVFAQALKDAYNHPDARWSDPDYVFLRKLAQYIEQHDAEDPA